MLCTMEYRAEAKSGVALLPMYAYSRTALASPIGTYELYPPKGVNTIVELVCRSCCVIRYHFLVAVEAYGPM